MSETHRTTVGLRGRITIPAAILEAAGIGVGDTVIFRVNAAGVVVLETPAAVRRRIQDAAPEASGDAVQEVRQLRQNTPDSPGYAPGDRVRYDDTTGTVQERIPSDRASSDNYRVSWDTGHASVVWGSDLTPEIKCTGWDGCPNPTACCTPQGCHCGA